MSDVENTTVTGTASWGSKSHSAATSGEKTFTVYLTEEGQSTVSKTISQSQITTSATAKGKAPIMIGTDGTPASCTTLAIDAVYGASVSTIGTYTWTKGQCPTIAIPTCLGKVVKGVDFNSNMKDDSWKVYATGTYTLNGCETEYAIYSVLTNGEPTAVIGDSAKYIMSVE